MTHGCDDEGMERGLAVINKKPFQTLDRSVSRTYFWQIGGFSQCIKKWGRTDVEISLKNYMYGGQNVIDPRVVAVPVEEAKK